MVKKQAIGTMNDEFGVEALESLDKPLTQIPEIILLSIQFSWFER